MLGGAPLVQARQWMTMGGRQIPPCFYSQLSARIAELRWPDDAVRPERHELKLMKYHGDVVWLAGWANIFTWFTLWIPWWLSHKAVCANTGLPTISKIYYLFFLPFIGVSIGLEFEALRRVLPSVVRIIEPQLPGLHTARRIEVYLAVMIIMSIINHADVMTNGIFVTRLLKTYDCDKEKYRYGHIRPLALVLWGAMFLIQFLYVVFAVIPTGRVAINPDLAVLGGQAVAQQEEEVEYYPEFDLHRRGEEEAANAVYRTCSEPTQTHQGSIYTLADGARWASIQNLERDYLHFFHIPRTSGSPALKAVKKTVYRCYVFLFLESTLFLLFQCWVRSLTRDPVMTVSIVTGLLAGMIALYTAWSTVRVYSEDVMTGYRTYCHLVANQRKRPTAADQQVPDQHRKFRYAFKFLLLVVSVCYLQVLLELFAGFSLP